MQEELIDVEESLILWIDIKNPMVVKRGKDESKCAVELPQTRAHLPTTGGVFNSFEHTGAQPYFEANKETLSWNGWSLTRQGGILTTRTRKSRHTVVC